MAAVRRSLLLLLILASPLAAQPRGQNGPRFFGRRGMTNDLMWLSSLRQVREELEADVDQSELLDALAMDLRDQRRTAFRGGFDAQPGAGDQDSQLQDIRQRLESLDRQSEELLATILESDQLERLKEIRLQWEGVRAFQREDFRAQLEVSDEQFDQIREVLQEANAQRRNGDDRRQEEQSGSRADEDLLSRVGEILTEEQRAKWQEMKGTPFDLPEPPGRFGRDDFRRRR